MVVEANIKENIKARVTGPCEGYPLVSKGPVTRKTLVFYDVIMTVRNKLSFDLPRNTPRNADWLCVIVSSRPGNFVALLNLLFWQAKYHLKITYICHYASGRDPKRKRIGTGLCFCTQKGQYFWNTTRRRRVGNKLLEYREFYTPITHIFRLCFN